MSRTAVRAFVHFTDDEVRDLYEYLRTLRTLPPAAPAVAARR